MTVNAKLWRTCDGESFHFETHNPKDTFRLSHEFGKAILSTQAFHKKRFLRAGIIGTPSAGNTTVASGILEALKPSTVRQEALKGQKLIESQHGWSRLNDLYLNEYQRLNALLQNDFRAQNPEGLDIVEHAQMDKNPEFDALIMIEYKYRLHTPEFDQIRSIELRANDTITTDPAFEIFLNNVSDLKTEQPAVV